MGKIRELRRLVENSFDAGLLLDETGIILHANDAACDLFKMRRTYANEKISAILKFSPPPSVKVPYPGGQIKWEEVLNLLMVQEMDIPEFMKIREWKARGTSHVLSDGHCMIDEFDARVKMSMIGDLKIGGGSSHVILFARSSVASSARNVDLEKPSEETEVEVNAIPSEANINQKVESKPYRSKAESTGFMKNENDAKMLTPSIISSSLQQKENMVMAIVEASLDPMFQINERGIIQMVNKAAVAEFGWKREEFLGRNISIICGGEHSQHHDGYIRRFLKTGESKVMGKKRELLARKKDGSEFPIELAVAEVDTFEGDERLFCGFIRNLTSMKQKQQLSVGVIEAALDPVLVIDEDGTIRMINVATTRKFGFRREELINNNIKMLAGLEDAYKFFKADGKKREMNARRANGTFFPIEVGVIEIETFNDKKMYCESIYDLTHIKEEDSFKASLVEASLDPMFLVNEHGIIQMINNGAVKQFGWTRDEFIGSNISMIAGGAHRKYHDDYMRRYLETGETKVIGVKREVPARRKDGSEFRAELGVVECETCEGDRLFCGYVHDLTEMKKKERLSSGIVEASLDAMFQINEKGIIRMVNKAAEDLFGWTRSEFLGGNISMIVGGEHGEHHNHYIQHYIRTGETRVIGKKRELTALRKDGTEFQIELGVTEIKTDDGDERLFCGFVRDLSAIKQKERLSTGLLESSFDPIFQINEERIIQTVNEAASSLFGWSQEEFIGSNINIITDGENADKLDNYIDDFLKREKDRIHVAGERQKLLARRKNEVTFCIELGIVEVITEKGEERIFICYIHDLSSIKRKERLSVGIIEASLDPMFQINAQGIIQMVNKAAVDLFGWTREEFLTKNISMIVGGQHGKSHNDYIQHNIKTGETRVIGKRRELSARRKNGTEFQIELGVAEIKTDYGEERLFCGFIRDLSNIKQKERLTFGLLEASFDPMFQINDQGIIQLVNEAAIKVFGWSREEFMGSNISMITGREHSANHDKYIRRYLRTGETRVIGKKRELPARRKDGSEFWIELGVAEIHTDELEERLFCGYVHDLSNIKKKERLYIGIIEASLDPMFQINEKGIIQMVNEAAVNLFGWTRDEFIGSNVSMITGDKHSEKHDSYIQRYLETGETRVIGKKRELPARRKDGTQFFIELGVVEIATDSTSAERLFCGFIRDLSSIKSKEQLSVGLIESSMDPMFQINEWGIIQMVNEAATKIFGWSRDEFVGNNISMIAGGEHGKNHDKYLRRYLRMGETRVIGKKRELPARRKDGSEFWVELGVTEIKTNNGEDRLFCGFVRDLTHIKQKESLSIALIESSLDPMFQINERGIIYMVNEAAIKLFGRTREEFVGSNISIIAGGDHASNHDSYLQRYVQTGETRVIGKKRVLPARRKDGSEIYVELGVAEVSTNNGDERLFCGYLHDLTDIRKKEQLAVGIIESSFDPMFQTDMFGCIQMVNEAAVSLFGWSREEFIGNNISIVCDGRHESMHKGYMTNYSKNGGETKVVGKKREMIAKKKDGTRFPIELGVVEINTGQVGDEKLFCGYIHDLTHRKKTENILRRKEAFTNNIIESSYSALLVVDKDGSINRVNHAAVVKFGWTREELCYGNVKIDLILSSDDVDWFKDVIEHHIETGKPIKAQREVDISRVDGKTLPVLLGIRELEGFNDDPDDHFAIFVEDLTHQKNMMQAEIERTAAEVLLLNVLPDQIAVRLRDDPSHIADYYDAATILFADIVGFTTMSSMMQPSAIVKMLNDLFSTFDDLVEKYDLNKIKTIGDAYMVASVPSVVGHDETEVDRVCYFALEMLGAVERYNDKNPMQTINIRIGINIGPVVAGVVGTQRFQYDLWGDAVNVASRMESTGLAGMVQVTKDVVDATTVSAFVFEKRGIISIKGKEGEKIETYFLLSNNFEPKLRRTSFLKQVQRLKSFRTGMAFRNKSIHMSLFESLQTLTSLEGVVSPATAAAATTTKKPKILLP